MKATEQHLSDLRQVRQEPRQQFQEQPEPREQRRSLLQQLASVPRKKPRPQQARLKAFPEPRETSAAAGLAASSEPGVPRE